MRLRSGLLCQSRNNENPPVAPGLPWCYDIRPLGNAPKGAV